MNTFYYIVDSIDGDYAHLARTTEAGERIEGRNKAGSTRTSAGYDHGRNTSDLQWMQYKVL